MELYREIDSIPCNRFGRKFVSWLDFLESSRLLASEAEKL